MNRKAVNILFLDKTLQILTAAILAVIVFTVTSFMYTGGLKEKNSRLETQLTRLLSESGKIIRLNADITFKEKKAATRRQAGVVSTLEQILKGLGIEARTIRPLGKKNINGFTEENAELEIKETDLNRVVNLLYQIDTSNVPLKIKNASIITTFEDPDKFILKLTVSYLKKQ